MLSRQAVVHVLASGGAGLVAGSAALDLSFTLDGSSTLIARHADGMEHWSQTPPAWGWPFAIAAGLAVGIWWLVRPRMPLPDEALESSDYSHPSRPLSVTVLAVLAVLAAIVVAAFGLLGTLVTACCGSPDEPDGTIFLVGLLAAAWLVGLSWLLLQGGRRRLVLTMSGVALLALGVVFLDLLVGWDAWIGIVLACWLRLWVVAGREPWRPWLDRARVTE